MRLGYRESSPPLSFLDHANRPIGYSLEICEAIVDEIGVEVDNANLKIDYVKVTSDSRIGAIVQNQIDFECGSTTANAERGKQVAFSPMIYVSGTKLMVPKASPINGPKDLAGKTIVVTKGGGGGGVLRTNRRCIPSMPNSRSASRSSPPRTTSSPIRCWSTRKSMRSRPTISCFMA